MQLREEIALRLLQINAIKLSPQNPFTWASGIKSPIYCDNRLVLSYPGIRTSIVKAFATASRDYAPFDLIAGVATAGISWGALLAQHLEKPFAYVRSKAKGHGRQNMIEGLVKPGQKVLVIEDLISTGGSSLAAVNALREAGCDVVATLAIFQYNFAQAAEAFQSANCTFATLTDYRALLSAARAESLFSSEQLDLLEQWYKDPHNWDIKESTTQE
jgi:orotate phosphoribosyltransferase